MRSNRSSCLKTPIKHLSSVRRRRIRLQGPVWRRLDRQLSKRIAWVATESITMQPKVNFLLIRHRPQYQTVVTPRSWLQLLDRGSIYMIMYASTRQLRIIDSFYDMQVQIGAKILRSSWIMKAANLSGQAYQSRCIWRLVGWRSATSFARLMPVSVSLFSSWKMTVFDPVMRSFSSWTSKEWSSMTIRLSITRSSRNSTKTLIAQFTRSCTTQATRPMPWSCPLLTPLSKSATE